MCGKDNLWVKYQTCDSLNDFLRGCLKGCRKQWERIKENYENLRKTNSVDEIRNKAQILLFDYFIYCFCQSQISLIINHIAGILNATLDNQELKHLKANYNNHFRPYSIVANGMKHLNRMINELSKKDTRHNVIFYNMADTKIDFGDTNAECVSEEPLKITEELFQKADKIISSALQSLREKAIEFTNNL